MKSMAKVFASWKKGLHLDLDITLSVAYEFILSTTQRYGEYPLEICINVAYFLYFIRCNWMVGHTEITPHRSGCLDAWMRGKGGEALSKHRSEVYDGKPAEVIRTPSTMQYTFFIFLFSHLLVFYWSRLRT